MKVADEVTKIGVKLEFIDFGGGLGIRRMHMVFRNVFQLSARG